MASSLEASPGGYSVSPSDSGRASPVPTKWSQFGSDETPSKDKAYRRYASSVERSLSLFDTALQEWADYISFLGRLLKSLQARPAGVFTIPSKNLVAKRLAQCLNPALPSGVHQKTLEVYSVIFTIIGSEALSRDLPLYLPGLASTLSFASLAVRPHYLDLLEQHLLQLDVRSMRPALKALILALLPGLEEETSEEFERTLRLLDAFKNAVRPSNSEDLGQNHESGDEYFWQCFFLAAITSKSRRLGALAYLMRNLPRLARFYPTEAHANDTRKGIEDSYSATLAEIVISPEPGLLVRCFAAGLGDEHILIQRGFQDLLVTHLPLHADVLQKYVKSEDLELLMIAAARVVSRREMSLNRRLWTWLLGPEPVGNENDGEAFSPNAQSNTRRDFPRRSYFENFGLKPLASALLKLIAHDTTSPTERARPFRICLSLMDRWEIGGSVVPHIFLPVIHSVQAYKALPVSKADFSEVLRSASVFFDGVESGLIWGAIIGLFGQSTGSDDLSTAERLERFLMVRFIINHFNVREEEMLLIHAPLALLTLLTMSRTASDGNKAFPQEVAMAAYEIAVSLIDLIPERAFICTSSPGQGSLSIIPEGESLHNLTNTEIIQAIQNFYVQYQGNLEASLQPISSQRVGELLFREAGQLASLAFSKSESSPAVGIKVKILVALLAKIPKGEGLDVRSMVSALRSRINASVRLPFQILSSAILLVTTLYVSSYVTLAQISELVDPFVRLAWSFLNPSEPKFHLEAVRSLWQLQEALSSANREIEAVICSIITEASNNISPFDKADIGRSLGILWTHTLQEGHNSIDRRSSKTSHQETKNSRRHHGAGEFEVMLNRPVFLVLDALKDEHTQLFLDVQTWLQSLVGIDKLLHLFVSKFSSIDFLKRPIPSVRNDGPTYTDDDDIEQCLYYISTLSVMLRISPENLWRALAETVTSTENLGSAVQNIPSGVDEISLLEFCLHVCLKAVSGSPARESSVRQAQISQLHRAALALIHQIFVSPYALLVADQGLENALIERLDRSIREPDPFVQGMLLEAVYDSLKLKNGSNPLLHQPSPRPEFRPPKTGESSILQLHSEQGDRTASQAVTNSALPSSLVRCILSGIAAESSRPVLDNWISFLVDCLPLYSDSIFQILIPLVESFCTQIQQTFTGLKQTFNEPTNDNLNTTSPESTLIALLNGLEHVLAAGHDRLLQDELKSPIAKSTEQPQGFFGNMVSGVFSSETPQTRSGNANNRLTVLLSFRDAVRICFEIWSWGGIGTSNLDIDSIGSFNYTSLRTRNRARRLLEHLFAAEALECLETVAEAWRDSVQNVLKAPPVFDLLHVLDGSRPKHTMPAIFNAIYSRTNPSALEPSRKSTLTSSLADYDLVHFLVEYAKSLEDDAMDEIWADCMTFLRDLLTNPFPHRQTLPSLLEFAAILGEKVDNTNFGEQRRMRRELGDLFLRLLTAMFTTRPIGFLDGNTDADSKSKPSSRSDDMVGVLASIAPSLPQILVEQERVTVAATAISASVLGPTFKSKSFPDNVSKSTLVLLRQLSRFSNTQKSWKKDIGDAFNDSRFFSGNLSLVESDWLPLLKQWCLSDKEKLAELVTRLLAPTTAGIVFGVGATSARLEADRRTQLNLRRIATLLLATSNDNFVADFPALFDKIVELLTATTTSSPSSTIRADIYLVIRALILKTTPVHLTALWPIVITELQAALSSVVAPDHSMLAETYNNYSTLQACKLLDCLICIAPDDFQLHRWLFITDTIDAVYRPSNARPTSFVDEISEELGSTAISSNQFESTAVMQAQNHQRRRPLIRNGGIDDRGAWERKDELVGRVLRPFFSQLSIFAFESTYSMGAPDFDLCKEGLFRDLFDEQGIVRSQ